MHSAVAVTIFLPYRIVSFVVVFIFYRPVLAHAFAKSCVIFTFQAGDKYPCRLFRLFFAVGCTPFPLYAQGGFGG